MDSHSLPTRAVILAQRHRRILAALCAALAVLIGLSAIRSDAAPGVDIVVAARDLQPGATIQPGDLTVTTRPRTSETAGSSAPQLEDLVGRMLAVGALAGEEVTLSRLANGAGARSLAPGEVAVPIRLADSGLADLMAPGDQVDLVSASGGSDRVIAEAARVITVPRRESRSPLSNTGPESASVLLVATDPRSAVQLAAAALRGPLAAIVRPSRGTP